MTPGLRSSSLKSPEKQQIAKFLIVFSYLRKYRESDEFLVTRDESFDHFFVNQRYGQLIGYLIFRHI